MTCGIYMIQNKVDGKIYIGQAVDIERRWRGHKSKLRSNRHKNEHLQSTWNKYGEDNFEFTIICECEENQLNTLEEYYIFELMSYDRRVGYNKTYGGGSGRPTEETLEKLAIHSRKNWEDPQYRETLGFYNNLRSKTFVQTTLDNRLIKIWKSSKDLFEKVDIKPRGFWGCLSNHQASTGNYKFYYLEEYIDKFGSIHTAIDDNEYIKAIEELKQQEKKNSLQRKLQYGFAKRLNKEIKPYINIAEEVHSYVTRYRLFCLTTGESFNSKHEAEIKYGIDLANKDSNLSFNGVYKGTPLVWTYTEELHHLSQDDINERIRRAWNSMKYYHGSTTKAIVCVELDKVFISIRYAARVFGVCNGNISRALKSGHAVKGYHFIRYSGGRPDFDETLKIQQKELKDAMRTNCSK